MKLQSSCWLGLQSLKTWVGWNFYIQFGVCTWRWAGGLRSSARGPLHGGCLSVLSMWQLAKWVISQREQGGGHGAFQRAVLDTTPVRHCNVSLVLFTGNDLLKTVVKERGTRLHYLMGGLFKNLWACFQVTMISHFCTLWLSWTPGWFTGSVLGKGMKSGKMHPSLPYGSAKSSPFLEWLWLESGQPKGTHL